MDERNQGKNMKQLRHIGRPRKYQSPEQLLEIADDYFEECIKNDKPLTITGVCQALGTTRHQFSEWLETYPPEFAPAIKSIKASCEQYAEEHGYAARNPAFAIFALKNYGWKDTQTVETTGFVEHRADPETLRVLSDFLAAASRSARQISCPPAIDILPDSDDPRGVVVKPATTGSYLSGQPSAKVGIETEVAEIDGGKP